MPAGVKGGADGTLTAFRCDCGHLIRQEASAVDGRVLWFHHGETLVGGFVEGPIGELAAADVCDCRLVPGCGGVVGLGLYVGRRDGVGLGCE